MRPNETIYRGTRVPNAGGPGKVTVQIPGHRPRPLRLRLDLSNHSPTGFQWGYEGSGPAQLALALLADVYGPEEEQSIALRDHQKFKRHVVGKLGDNWELTAEQIRWGWAMSVEAERERQERAQEHA